MENGILTDELNEINDNFDKIYSLISFATDEKSGHIELNEKSKALYEAIKKIEFKLQDLTENINANNEFQKENKYITAIKFSKVLIEYWVNQQNNPSNDYFDYLLNNLKNLFNYLNSFLFEKGTYLDVVNSFNSNFGLVEINKKIIIHNNFSNQAIYKKQIVETSSKKFKKNTNTENIDIKDGENILYIGNLELWINTVNASEANKFMFIVSNILANIENVELEIEQVKISSYLQKLGLKIKGWYAKEEVQKILSKGCEAAESYSLDKHIEPIKKSQSERRKIEEEIDRMMPLDLAKELQNIEVETAKADLESKKLANLEKKLALTNTLSEMLKNGLLSIDSDYRISLNNILLIEQTNKNIRTNKNIEGIDFGYRKELLKEKPIPEETTSSDEEEVEIP